MLAISSVTKRSLWFCYGDTNSVPRLNIYCNQIKTVAVLNKYAREQQYSVFDLFKIYAKTVQDNIWATFQEHFCYIPRHKYWPLAMTVRASMTSTTFVILILTVLLPTTLCE